MQTETNQVAVAEKNLEVANENPGPNAAGSEAGVAESVELVQSQEALATAELDSINSGSAHNLAKLMLARLTGRAVEVLAKFLTLQ